MLDLASIYEHEVTKEMTLNPGADLATIVSNCDSAVKTIVLQEGAKWSPQSQAKWDTKHQECCEKHHTEYQELIENKGMSEMRLQTLVGDETDEGKKMRLQRELEDARSQ